jgi:hypothetical protein
MKSIFPLIGIAFIIAFFFTDPEAKTDDGYSLRYFFLVMGIWFAGLPFLIGSVFSLVSKRKESKKKYFLSHGRKASATILNYYETGTKLNNVPLIKFDLKIKNIYGKEFNAYDKKFISITEIPKLKPGLEIPALTHPQKENDFLVLWDESGIKTSF